MSERRFSQRNGDSRPTQTWTEGEWAERDEPRARGYSESADAGPKDLGLPDVDAELPTHGLTPPSETPPLPPAGRPRLPSSPRRPGTRRSLFSDPECLGLSATTVGLAILIWILFLDPPGLSPERFGQQLVAWFNAHLLSIAVTAIGLSPLAAIVWAVLRRRLPRC